MSMFLAVLALVGGLAVLIAGADFLVRGSAQLARVMGLSAFAIGVTVVAFGTSAPELFASIGAALQGVPDLAIGNVVGSNIANILLIMGVGALMSPMVVERRVRLVEMPIMLVITIAASVLLIDFSLTRFEGGLLAAGLVGYVLFIVRSHRVEIVEEAQEVVTHPKPVWIDVLMIVGGVVALGIGAKALVYGASEIAMAVGVPAGVVGTTVVAFGTSLPELAATVRAALGKSTDIAVGNVVGSNIFNLLSVLGITALIQPLAMPASMAWDIWVMLGVSVFWVVLAALRPGMGRVTGAFFAAGYCAYIAVSFLGR
ncbi:MAG: calcium/sodium antiporter [Phycisphaerales bacterium]